MKQCTNELCKFNLNFECTNEGAINIEYGKCESESPLEEDTTDVEHP